MDAPNESAGKDDDVDLLGRVLALDPEGSDSVDAGIAVTKVGRSSVVSRIGLFRRDHDEAAATDAGLDEPSIVLSGNES